MIRYVWISLMCVLALLACGAQLDRQSRRDPILAPLVPPMFRSFAQARHVIATVRSAEPAQALEAAELLVQRRPVPAEHLSLLAIAKARNEDSANALLLLQTAAQRGWRDSIAQQSMFGIAFNAGDMAEASRRLAALWAIGETQMPLAAATAKVLATPEGRKAMAATMSTSGRWTSAFLNGSEAIPPQDLAQTIALAADQGARLNCAILQRIETGYAKRKLAGEADMIASARRTCAR
jgi:hypothetical protein